MTVEDARAMRDCARLPRCPGCGEPMPRDHVAEGPKAGHAFREYLAVSGGVPECVMRRAVRDGDRYVVPRPDGTLQPLHLPGERLDPRSGAVVISSRAERRRYLRRRGLTDYG